jgi:hypothetical protein
MDEDDDYDSPDEVDLTCCDIPTLILSRPASRPSVLQSLLLSCWVSLDA